MLGDVAIKVLDDKISLNDTSAFDVIVQMIAVAVIDSSTYNRYVHETSVTNALLRLAMMLVTKTKKMNDINKIRASLLHQYFPHDALDANIKHVLCCFSTREIIKTFLMNVPSEAKLPKQRMLTSGFPKYSNVGRYMSLLGWERY